MNTNIKDFLIVTSFNQKLHDIYANKFIDSYFNNNLPFDLHIYSETSLKIDQKYNKNKFKIINLFEINSSFKKFVEKHDVKNKNGIFSYVGGIENILRDTVRFSYKVFSLIHAVSEKKYKYVVWIDADFIFRCFFDNKLFNLLISNNSFMSYLGRKPKFSECGFLIFNTSNYKCDIFFNNIKNLYLSEKIFNLPETHDSYVWDYIRQNFEKEDKNFINTDITSTSYDLLLNTKNIDKKFFISNSCGSEVLNRTILYIYMYHNKGHRKIKKVREEKLEKISTIRCRGELLKFKNLPN